LSAALLRLKGAASEFIQVESPDISTFDNFKQALIKRFVRGEDRFALLQSFISCHQLFNESVLDYKQRLRKLANHTVLHYEGETLQNQENARVEKDLLQKFITGLQPHFKKFVIEFIDDLVEAWVSKRIFIKKKNINIFLPCYNHPVQLHCDLVLYLIGEHLILGLDCLMPITVPPLVPGQLRPRVTNPAN